jgi:hypothetical protein
LGSSLTCWVITCCSWVNCCSCQGQCGTISRTLKEQCPGQFAVKECSLTRNGAQQFSRNSVRGNLQSRNAPLQGMVLMQFSRITPTCFIGFSQVRDQSIRGLQYETTWRRQFIPASAGRVLQWSRQYGCRERLKRELGVPLLDT